MTAARSRRTLWLGLGLILAGLVGIRLLGPYGTQPVPFSGWGGGGLYDKGSYASNGERIYYLGIDSEGRRIPFRGGPHWLRMMGGSCVNCHGPDGRGGFPVMMGTRIPHDIRYASLRAGQGGGEGEVPYTDEDIARAITQGVEPSGEALDPTMPRWRLREGDAEDLLAYLKTLGQ